jgi:hypothetical protein
MSSTRKIPVSRLVRVRIFNSLSDVLIILSLPLGGAWGLSINK